MRFIYLVVIVSSVLLGLNACKQKATEKKPSSTLAAENLVTGQSEIKSAPGFLIKGIVADTLLNANKTSGINLLIDAELSEAGLKTLVSSGFNGAYLNCKVVSSSGKVYETRASVIAKSDAVRLNANKKQFFAHPAERKVSVHIPWRLLQLEEGAQELDVFVEWKALQYSDDTAGSDYHVIKYIDEASYSVRKGKLAVLAPHLHSVSFEVLPFELNTDVVDPSKFDFALGGSGYPDLYWKLFCGDEVLFFSPQKKNKLMYDISTTSPVVKCTSRDMLRFCISDFDNGPFNTDDIIVSWYGHLNELPEDSALTLPFKEIKGFRVRKIMQ